jgi:hypothetical protein
MWGLTPLGTVHTAISLIAVAAGVLAFVRHGEISPDTRSGMVYVGTTVVTALTGFGIFQNGELGPPHVLGVITLVVLAVAASTRRTGIFGSASPYVETVSYSATFFFHLIPGITETVTRLPLGAPLVTSREAPALVAAIATLFVAFLIGATLQVWQLRERRRRKAA